MEGKMESDSSDQEKINSLPIWEHCLLLGILMRIIAVKTLKHYWEEYPEAAGALFSWYEEVSEAEWETPNDLKEQFGSASLVGGKRVIFNIHGNKFRLIVDIEFKFKIVFVIWFGPHARYDQIDAKTVSYVKTDKK